MTPPNGRPATNRPATRPTVYPALRYRDARAAIELLKEAFGFTELAVHEDADGGVAHAELAHGNGVVMLGTAGEQPPEGSYDELAGEPGPVSVYVVVDDPDAHHDRALAHGGVHVVRPLTDQEYGSRDYVARDPEGNLWCFGTYSPELPPAGDG
ncbi:VOC family protein [Actinacidiphila yeochonensis]|uniref:VOC family protein n=1 Tax=Actinacidiphila yeochonensis TaxID=89050 RepID=UPI00068BE79F|nr:VOC family protein [Actinacidiphila yeochonensis]